MAVLKSFTCNSNHRVISRSVSSDTFFLLVVEIHIFPHLKNCILGIVDAALLRPEFLLPSFKDCYILTLGGSACTGESAWFCHDLILGFDGVGVEQSLMCDLPWVTAKCLGCLANLPTLAGQISLPPSTVTSKISGSQTARSCPLPGSTKSHSVRTQLCIQLQTSREPLSRFLVLLLCALSKSPVIHPTNPSCPRYLRLQSLCPLSRKISPSLGSTLYATVWVENRWMSGSPHVFSFLKDHNQVGVRILET